MIAIIAGTGNLPIEAIKNLQHQHQDFIVINLFPEDNQKELLQVTLNKNQIISKPFYKAGQILSLLKTRNVKSLLLVGKVDKRNLFKNLKLDWLTIKTIAKAATKSDSTLMQAIINQIENEGIKVLNQTENLKNLFVNPGILVGKLTTKIKNDIDFGLNAANQLSKIDIGQTVIVKDKMIIAAEAIEGTDNCIKRGIELGQKDLVICKTAHQNQNTKFDIPTLGPKTLEQIKKGEVKAIAWHSNRTFINNKNEFIKIAK